MHWRSTSSLNFRRIAGLVTLAAVVVFPFVTAAQVPETLT